MKKADTPETWGHEASDFVNKLVKRKVEQRLGLNGALEIKNHIWFREFNWTALFHKKIKPPFVPPRHFENVSRKQIREGVKLLNYQLTNETFKL